MSSVTRFMKQVAPSNTYYNVNSAVLAGTNLYELVPSARNVVANYPPGYVQLMSGGSLPTQLAAQGDATNLVLRDMGKTIYAPVASLSGNAGYFRQVQLMKPGVLSSAGVLGAAAVPDAYSPYFTCYIAVPMNGVLAGVLSGLSAVAGGQM